MRQADRCLESTSISARRFECEVEDSEPSRGILRSQQVISLHRVVNFINWHGPHGIKSPTGCSRSIGRQVSLITERSRFSVYVDRDQEVLSGIGRAVLIVSSGWSDVVGAGRRNLNHWAAETVR